MTVLTRFKYYPFDKVIMGIDPGTNLMGYAIIGTKGDLFELIELHHLNFKNRGDHLEKLKGIAEELSRIIDEYKPNEMAIESPFHSKNIQSMLKLGRAQGVAMTIGITKGVKR